MAYRLTLTPLPITGGTDARSSSVPIETEAEAIRTAQEAAMMAKRRGRHVTCEVHDEGGRLVVSYTSAAIEV